MLDQLAFDLTPADFADDLGAYERGVLAEARAILARHLTGRDVISSWNALTDYLAATLGAARSESFRVLLLDRKNCLIRDVEMGQGTVDHVPVYPREIMRQAIQHDACAIILAHNHPSGDPTPSQSDIAMTKQVQTACDALGVTLHDHVIIGRGDTLSMRAQGLI